MANFCLTLLCPPSGEEKLLDWLLSTSDCEVFTSIAASSHGLAHSSLSPSEQVLGHSASAQIQLMADEALVDRLLAQLREDFRGAGIRYWAFPVVLEGDI